MGTRFVINYPNQPPTLDGNLPKQLTSWVPQRRSEDNGVFRQGEILLFNDQDAVYFRNNYVVIEPISVMIGPPQVSGLIARGGPSSVILNWGAIYPAPGFYTIERSTDNVNFTVIGTNAVTLSDLGNSFTDTTVVLGTTYYYKVNAIDSYSLAPNPIGSFSSTLLVPGSSILHGELLLISGGSLLLISGGSLELINH